MPTEKLSMAACTLIGNIAMQNLSVVLKKVSFDVDRLIRIGSITFYLH